MAGFKPNVHTRLEVYTKTLLQSSLNQCKSWEKLKHQVNFNGKTFLVNKKKQTNECNKKLLGVCLCVHVLTGVPVCKKLRCAHVNNKRATLVKRTCVANLLRACKDHALICTVTGNNILADLQQLSNRLTPKSSTLQIIQTNQSSPFITMLAVHSWIHVNSLRWKSWIGPNFLKKTTKETLLNRMLEILCGVWFLPLLSQNPPSFQWPQWHTLTSPSPICSQQEIMTP